MPAKRKSIRVFPHERYHLVQLYLNKKIPIDQFEVRPEELRELADSWNAMSGRNDSPEEVLHYMRTQRKGGRWVRFDGTHKPPPENPAFDADETEILVQIYFEHVAELNNGSDVLAYDEGIREFVSREFAMQTGRRVPSHLLVGKITSLRKRGLLPKVSKPKDEGGLGFADIDHVA